MMNIREKLDKLLDWIPLLWVALEKKHLLLRRYQQL